MAIRRIGYQPVIFRTEAEIEADNCECSNKPFCQLVNQNDATQFQIQSDNEITNGTFDTDLTGWTIGQSITATANITNETSEGACDGSVTVTGSGGTGPYTYSKDGGVFQVSGTFSGLCADCYSFVAKDSLGNLGFVSACVDTNIVCGAYDETDELLPFQTSQLLNCLTSDFI